MVMTGCPSEFGKNGRVAKAVHDDSMEVVRHVCPKDTYDRYCSGGRENTEDCLRECPQ